ncbi:hypothetical protein ACFFRR_009980 [Megaselia abdita]
MLPKGLFSLLTIIVVIAVCKASEERKQKMCGPVLYQALENICKNGFNTRDRKSGKQEYYFMVYEYLLVHVLIVVPITGQDDYDSSDWTYGNNYVRRRRFDIVTECCRNPCSYETLKLYCLE